MSLLNSVGVGEAEVRGGACWLQSFVASLRAAGYSEHSVKKRQWAAGAFIRWMELDGTPLVEASEKQVAAFLERGEVRTEDRRLLERAATRLFLGHLRETLGVVPRRPVEAPTLSQATEQSYATYLRSERALAERSVQVYLPYVRDFIGAHEANLGSFSPPEDAQQVQDYVLERTRGRQTEYCNLVCTVIRSFLRFLFWHGAVPTDLTGCVPTVRRWSLSHVPQFLTPGQVEHVLATTDQTMPKGQRDYAILTLLARLGLRAGEVVALELADIRWRTGELVVHGKGRQVDSLPLVADVGEALAQYIQNGRQRSDSPRVFLRSKAPTGGLGGPASVGHVVRSAFARAGIRRAGRDAAHLFRHSLATRMIRNGASLAEVSEILRHRSLSSSELYTKVSFESLGLVARPWPNTGGES